MVEWLEGESDLVAVDVWGVHKGNYSFSDLGVWLKNGGKWEPDYDDEEEEKVRKRSKGKGRAKDLDKGKRKEKEKNLNKDHKKKQSKKKAE